MLNVGVIGVSGRGSLAAYAHSKELDSQIIAGADPHEPAQKTFAGKYPKASVYDTHQDLLKNGEIEAVFVCSPDHFHEEHAVAALEAGKAVYLEKPIAITIKGADRILETAKRTKSKLYLGHNMRYFPAILKMKELLDAGTIGELQAVWCRHFVAIGGDAYFKDWHSERKNSTGLFLQKGAHDIDVIHWLSGGYARNVVAMGKLSVYNRAERRSADDHEPVSLSAEHWPPLAAKDYSPNIDIEDHSMMLFTLDNGVQCSYMQCHYTPDYWRNYTFIGTEGRIENIGDSGACEIRVYNNRMNDEYEGDVIHKLRPSSGSHGGSDPAIVKSFIEFVRNGTIPNTSPVAARYAVAAGVMGTESLRNGCGLRDVPPLDPELEAYFNNGQK